jgi:hypothetical protein
MLDVGVDNRKADSRDVHLPGMLPRHGCRIVHPIHLQRVQGLMCMPLHPGSVRIRHTG